MRLLCAFLLMAGAALPQAAGDVNARYRTAEGRKQVANGLNNPERAKTQKPEAIVSALALRPGMTVADIGTGTGFMLPYLSKAVAPGGTVIGEDVQTDFLDQAKQRAAKERLANVSFVLGTFTDPKLPAGAADVALVLDVYHHIDDVNSVLAGLRRGLKPGGRLAIVEFHKADSPQPGHIMREWSEVVKEVEANGFHLTSKIDRITATQYLLMFERK